MLFWYNLFQFLLLTAIGPLAVFACLALSKYRARLWQRLGFGLPDFSRDSRQPRIWVHALSVGEVRSSWPLLAELKRLSPAATIILSTTTATGQRIAAGFSGLVDAVIPFPFDILPVVRWFFSRIRPDAFVLIETDFWPNFLAEAKRRAVPAFLANGRVSAPSYNRYRCAKRFFAPLFASFTRLGMQTEEDVARMISLGVAEDKVVRLGNLKYDAALAGITAESPAISGLPADRLLLVAGSTHPGEEDFILIAAKEWREEGIAVSVVIAPRDISRAREIAALASGYGFSVAILDEDETSRAEIIVVDTLGRLVSLYAACDLAFVGGSLVACGGHNPLEAAVFGRPVLFGPHMEDFLEIRDGLIAAGGALVVADGEDLRRAGWDLLRDPEKRRKIGEAGRKHVAANRGAAAKLAELVLASAAASKKKSGGDGHHAGS